jgi:hypothetical protein
VRERASEMELERDAHCAGWRVFFILVAPQVCMKTSDLPARRVINFFHLITIEFHRDSDASK